MTRLAVVLFAIATLTTGCASMGTKRSAGAQITRSAEPAPTVDTGSIDARPELGQR